MKARIYRPAKTAMQSGRGKTKRWVLEYEPAARPTHDPLMGWTSSTDMPQEVRLWFDTKEEALAHCKRVGIEAVVHEPHERRIKPKNYASNFRWDRVA